MMRKSPTIAPRPCEACGEIYTPSGSTQKFCPSCKIIKTRETKKRYEKKTYPDRKPKQKCTDPCCICGGPFACHYEGKPYCNKHYLRMRLNGTVEPKPRQNTCQFSIRGDVLEITTAKGETILADASDYDVISKHSWCVSSQGYAVANINGRVVKMNRYILGLENGDGRIVDHKNRKKLDNRRKNLRFATAKENARNCGAKKNNAIGAIGIRILQSGKYNASILVDRRRIHIGNFDTLEEAIEARRAAEDKYHGEFASHKGDEDA